MAAFRGDPDRHGGQGHEGEQDAPARGSGEEDCFSTVPVTSDCLHVLYSTYDCGI